MALTSNDFGEKRNFIRMFIDANVSITDPISGETFEGTSNDLSGDGVSIKTNKEFKLEQQLEVHIRSKQGSLSPLTAKLTVKRVQKLEEELFEVAGSIDSVS